MPYFGEPVGRVKIQTMSKNAQRYYTTKRLIRGLLSNDLFSQNSSLPSFFNLYTAGRNETCDISTRFARHLYSSKQRVIKCVLGQNTFLLQ